MKIFSAVRQLRRTKAIVGIGGLVLLAGCASSPQGNMLGRLSGYGMYRPPVEQNEFATGIAEAELRDAVGLEPGATRTETLLREMLGLPSPGATLRRYKYKDENGNRYKGKVTKYRDGRVRHKGKINGKKFKYESW